MSADDENEDRAPEADPETDSDSDSDQDPDQDQDSDQDQDPDPDPDPDPDQDQDQDPKPRLSDRRLALLLYAAFALVYCLTSYGRLLTPTPDNHFVHLAASWMNGQLHLQGDPPGTNDWACFDTETHDLCPNNRWHFRDAERYRWYVSFPPFPGVVMAPFVAAFGTDVPDRLVWCLLAGFAPMLLFLLLCRLRPRSGRRRRDDVLLTVLFGLGTVFFYTAVQGTVWFAAHVVAVSLILLYLLFGIDCRKPLLAGLALGCCFLTRPTTALLAIFFAVELLRTHRKDDAATPATDDGWMRRAWLFWRGADLRAALRPFAMFSAPILVCGVFAMWHNDARFEDPFEWGHTYLQIRWRPRIETWGLFNYHYFAKNLAVFGASMPWLSLDAPYLTVSRHGLALWVTTPGILLALWPKRTSPLMVGLWCAIVPVALMNLCYQNSGWVQFGYRFALDWLPLLFVLLALGRRRFRAGFALLLLWSIAINLFGALTFDRAWQFYDNDATQNVMFQPD